MVLRVHDLGRKAIFLLVVLPILSVLSTHSLSGQRPAPLPSTLLPELFPASGGWLGVRAGILATRLTLYDSLFQERSQSLWTGLDPLDFSNNYSSSDSGSSGLLLANTNGVPTLYRIALDSTLLLTPIWGSNDGFRPNGIITIPGAGALLYSDREVRYLDSASSVGASLPLELHAPPRLTTSGELFVVRRDYAGLRGSWLDPVSLNMRKDLLLSTADARVDISYHHSPQSANFLVSIPESGERIILDIENREVRTITSPSGIRGFPLLYTPSEEEEAVFAVVSTSYPGPRLFGQDHPFDPVNLYYPLQNTPSAFVALDNWFLLATDDSLSLYWSGTEFVNSFDASTGENPRLYWSGIDSLPLLLSSENGSRLLSTRSNAPNWLELHGSTVAYGIVAALLLLASIILFYRYRRMRAVYRSLVLGDHSAGILLFSPRSRLLQINSAGQGLLFLPESTPLGRHASTYLQEEALREIEEAFREYSTTGVSIDRQVAVTRETSTLTYRVIIRRMSGRYGSNRGTLLAIEDHTEHVENDRLLNWASVAHHIAHEMKTPLSTIRLSANQLRNELVAHGIEDTTLGLLGRVIRQSARLREIVEDLLSVARTDALVAVPIDLLLMARSVADDLREYLPETCTIRVESDLTSCPYLADAEQLSVALRNLLENARQAVGTRENGEIILALERTDKAIRLMVNDNGTGMTTETRKQLFQPFFTNKKGGSGIGTVILKRVVEGHGGSISVHSTPGIGSTFVLSFPLQSEEIEEKK